MTRAKELLVAATPLPWRTFGESAPEGWELIGIENEHGGYPGEQGWAVRFDDDWGTDQHANAALIVYAVNRLPDYEAAVEALDGLEFSAGKIIEKEPHHYYSEWLDFRRHLDGARAALARLRPEVPA